MSKQMNLESYKENVKAFLIKNNNFTEVDVNKLMKTYEDELSEFYQDNWEMPTVAAAMIMGY